MKVISRSLRCTAHGNRPLVNVAVCVEESVIISLSCPLRCEGVPCNRVDIDKLPCALFPEYSIDEKILVTP